MKVTNLELTNFRNYKYLSAEFSDGINYIVGENAKGKTNLVEAIYTLSFGKSFRTNDTLEMINKDSKYSIIKAKTKSETSSKDIDVYLLSEGKKIRVNKKPISKLSDLNGIINVLCFTPKDVNLLKDSPSQRRKFLNQNISKSSKIYLSSLMDYEKVLKQRNDLLKQEKVNFDYLGILTDYLVRLSKKSDTDLTISPGPGILGPFSPNGELFVVFSVFFSVAMFIEKGSPFSATERFKNICKADSISSPIMLKSISAFAFVSSSILKVMVVSFILNFSFYVLLLKM
jgi:hypothetical protein